MKATEAEIQKALMILEETPRRLFARTSNLRDANLHFSPDAKSWSASDILAHLRSCADVWTHSIYAMLAEENPVLPDINERKWAKVTRYAELPFAESLQAFSWQRANLLRVLKELPFESWERSAIIFERKHTVFTQTRRMAKHESEHWKQLEELLK
ncbi:MAG TPA: DinB family protein [Anaerolineales bacterium]|nr:DinB family protein [Anaerolineales bacterium]